MKADQTMWVHMKWHVVGAIMYKISYNIHQVLKY
jgi:hypothetical protein